ncbi:MAG TPA: hypothetical protein VJ873_01580 [bacterium]|nr:hypothetical protein [bacterium]
MTPLQSPTLKDHQMEKAIHRAIHAKGIKPWLQVIVRDGYVHLFGFADVRQEKREITD